MPALLAGGALLYELFEAGATLYDAFEFVETLRDPCSDFYDASAAGAGLAAGMFLPGGGYGAAAKGSQKKFRKGLAELTGEMPDDMDAHHVFPRTFAKEFKDLGIDFDDPAFGAWWDSRDHRAKAYEYNFQWMDFFTRPRPRKRP